MTSTSDCEVTVSGLTEKKVYVMRVAARNEVGVGEFAEIADVIPKSPFGANMMFLHSLYMYLKFAFSFRVLYVLR